MSPTTTRQMIKFSRIAALGVVILAALVTILGKGGGDGTEPLGNQAPQVTSWTDSADIIAFATAVGLAFLAPLSFLGYMGDRDARRNGGLGIGYYSYRGRTRVRNDYQARRKRHSLIQRASPNGSSC